MRILIINNVYPDRDNPTSFVFVHQQARILKKAGYDIYVLDIDLRSIRWKRRIGVYEEEYDGIRVYRVSFPFVTVKFRRFGKFLNETIAKCAAKSIFLKWGKPDVIHAHFGFGAGNAGSALKRKYKIPLVITEHSSAVINAKSKEECRYFCEAYKEADIVMCVGNALKDKLKSFGVKNVQVLPNIIDSERFRPQNVSKEKLYTYISVGHLIPRKNQKDLIKAFSKININGKNRLIIIGNGPVKESLVSLADTLGCLKSIEFIDRVPNDELPDMYSRCSCFVLPSLFETFGVVYAEAISCGIPAIGYMNGGAEDIINSHVGILVKERNIEVLANAMEVVKNKVYDSNTLNSYIKEMFGTDIFIKRIGEIYDNFKKSNYES